MRYLLACICLCIFWPLCAQRTYGEDSLRLIQTIEWLERKLTYHYYNVDDQEWWINRFTYNHSSQTITIKNIASPQLQAVSDKTYLQLNFKLEDLNPYTISIEKNEKNAGRLVAGKTIRIGAYHHDKSIKKTRNGQISSNISFLYLSIPKHYEDSVSTYAEDIANRLREAIVLSTRIGSTPGEALPELLQDRFISADRSWHISSLYPDVLQIEVQDKALQLMEKRFLRFLNVGQLELTVLRPDAPTQVFLLQRETGQPAFSDDTHRIAFITRNEFTVQENGQTLTFIRDWTFDESR